MYVPTLFVRERYGKSKKLLSLSIHRQMILKISLLQIYEKFFILSFCRGEKVICMALWVKIGIHKKKGRSRTNIPGICGVAGEGHRIYAGPYRVPPGRYSFPVLSAGEPVCRGVFWQIFSYAWR